MEENKQECVNCGKECEDDAVIFNGHYFCCGECVCKCEGIDDDTDKRRD